VIVLMVFAPLRGWREKDFDCCADASRGIAAVATTYALTG